MKRYSLQSAGDELFIVPVDKLTEWEAWWASDSWPMRTEEYPPCAIPVEEGFEFESPSFESIPFEEGSKMSDELKPGTTVYFVATADTPSGAATVEATVILHNEAGVLVKVEWFEGGGAVRLFPRGKLLLDREARGRGARR